MPLISDSGHAEQLHAILANEFSVMSSQSVTLLRSHPCSSFRLDFSGSNRLSLFRDMCDQLHMNCSAWQFSHMHGCMMESCKND